MSTIHHHPAHPHVWLYAAAAVAAGLLVMLITTVFASSSGSGSPPPTDTGGSTVTEYHGPMFKEVCFAMRRGATIELAQSGCLVRTP